MGRFSEALETARSIDRVWPEDYWKRAETLRDLAAALAQAGRAGEAAPDFAAAARALASADAETPEVLRLERQAAEQYLRSGHIEEGLDVLRAVLGTVGESYPAATASGALAAVALQRVRLAIRGLAYEKRAESDVPRDRLARIDACWTASVGLVWVDPVRSADFHGRHVRMALDAGEPGRVVRALCTEAAYQAAFGGRAARARAERSLLAARQLTAELDDPVADGLTAVCAAGTSYFSGHFPEGAALSREAEEILRTRCTGIAWELTNAHIFGMWSLAHMGEIEHLRAVVPGILREASERGDLLASSSLAAGIPTSLRFLADDRPEEARRHVAEAFAGWRGTSFHLPHYYGVVSETLADLYAGDPVRAWRRITAAWPSLREIRLLDFQLLRVELLALRARCAIAAAATRASTAATEGWSRKRLLRYAARAARRVGREDMPAAVPLAALLRAGLAASRGDDDATREALADAAAGFEAAGMVLPRAAARLRRGSLLGGDEGRREAEAGAAALQGLGVQQPEAMLEMLAPIPRFRGS